METEIYWAMIKNHVLDSIMATYFPKIVVVIVIVMVISIPTLLIVKLFANI